MSDSYSDPQQQGGQVDGGRDGQRSRGNRGGGREGGGFRIRLSDNEMRSARALQEAFNLRSTVAVLGFAVRSLGQMLEDSIGVKPSPEDLQNMVREVDADGNGSLEFAEFCRLASKLDMGEQTPDDMKAASS